MPQLFEETANGFRAGGILGLHADHQIRLDGCSVRDLCIEYLNGHPIERAGGGEKTYGGAIVTVEFTDQFSQRG